MVKITAIVNQKGGVEKTTTALNFGYALSEKGKKVLLIDFDPQLSLISALGYNTENKESIQTLMNLAIEEEELIEIENYIQNIKENLDIIPCSLELSGIEMGLVNVISGELILKSIIEEIEKDYDYALIDCSPVLRWMMYNIYIRTDPAGNIKADKEKTTKKIDGAVATIMALDRAIRCGSSNESVYDNQGIFFI